MEAIKSSVETNLGVAFVSAAAIEKEVELGRLHAVRIKGVPLARTLLCVTDPARYCSKAARSLIREFFGLAVELAPQGCFLPNPPTQNVRPVCPRAFWNFPSAIFKRPPPRPIDSLAVLVCNGGMLLESMKCNLQG